MPSDQDKDSARMAGSIVLGAACFVAFFGAFYLSGMLAHWAVRLAVAGWQAGS